MALSDGRVRATASAEFGSCREVRSSCRSSSACLRCHDIRSADMGGSGRFGTDAAAKAAHAMTNCATISQSGALVILALSMSDNVETPGSRGMARRSADSGGCPATRRSSRRDAQKSVKGAVVNRARAIRKNCPEVIRHSRTARHENIDLSGHPHRQHTERLDFAWVVVLLVHVGVIWLQHPGWRKAALDILRHLFGGRLDLAVDREGGGLGAEPEHGSQRADFAVGGDPDRPAVHRHVQLGHFQMPVRLAAVQRTQHGAEHEPQP